MRVLIIDDDPGVNYRVFAQLDDVELFVNEDCADPKLIIVDPGERTTCEVLNSLSCSENTAIIIATARGDILHCRDHGEVAAITKPFRMDELAELATSFFDPDFQFKEGTCH